MVLARDVINWIDTVEANLALMYPPVRRFLLERLETRDFSPIQTLGYFHGVEDASDGIREMGWRMHGAPKQKQRNKQRKKRAKAVRRT